MAPWGMTYLHSPPTPGKLPSSNLCTSEVQLYLLLFRLFTDWISPSPCGLTADRYEDKRSLFGNAKYAVCALVSCPDCKCLKMGRAHSRTVPHPHQIGPRIPGGWELCPCLPKDPLTLTLFSGDWISVVLFKLPGGFPWCI